MTETMFIWWFVVAVISYRLREIPHIWSKSITYNLRLPKMYSWRWFTDSAPRKNSLVRNTFGINSFDDAYHFFGNLPRVHLSIILFFGYGLIYAVMTFILWAVISEMMLRILIKDVA